jgi:hypothetical protein
MLANRLLPRTRALLRETENRLVQSKWSTWSVTLIDVPGHEVMGTW